MMNKKKRHNDDDDMMALSLFSSFVSIHEKKMRSVCMTLTSNRLIVESIL